MTTRRDFLKLLGVGAAVAGGGGLFSSRVGDLLIVRGEHYVYDEGRGPVLDWDARAFFLTKNRDGTTTILRLRSNTSRYRHPMGWSPTGDAVTYQVDVPIFPGEDPHVAFYMAASKLRDAIDNDVQELTRTMSGLSLAMVTRVDMPIMALPHPEQGFYLETQLSQYAARPSEITNRDKAVSAVGEIPMEVPDNIGMKYLMLMQEELKEMGMLHAHVPVGALAKASRKVQWGAPPSKFSLVT